MFCSISDIHNVINVTLPKSEKYVCKELWDKTETVVSDKITANVEGHGVKVFRISAN